jgi:hypothetical protein
MKLNLFKFGLLLTTVLLISCDGLTGMDGVVNDSKTGEKLEGVNIEMTSNYKTIKTTTDTSGEFFTSHSYSCGIKKCDDSFTIKFEKDGYEKLELNENYLSDTLHVDYDNKINVKLTRK